MTAPSRRFPLAPLAAAVRVEMNPPAEINAQQDGVLRGVVGLAEMFGTSANQVRRWSTFGIPEKTADGLACRVAKMHPCSIWPEWDDPEPVDIEENEDQEIEEISQILAASPCASQGTTTTLERMELTSQLVAQFDERLAILTPHLDRLTRRVRLLTAARDDLLIEAHRRNWSLR